jgi:hypothetical protein
MDWALIAYRKHQKTYAKDVKRELARLWVLKGGDCCFEAEEMSIGLVECRGRFFLDEVIWEGHSEEWTSSCGYVIHDVWQGTEEERASTYGTLIPIVIEVV